MVEQRTLTPLVLVRVQVPQPSKIKSLAFSARVFLRRRLSAHPRPAAEAEDSRPWRGSPRGVEPREEAAFLIRQERERSELQADAGRDRDHIVVQIA